MDSQQSRLNTLSKRSSSFPAAFILFNDDARLLHAACNSPAHRRFCCILYIAILLSPFPSFNVQSGLKHHPMFFFFWPELERLATRTYGSSGAP